MSDADPISPEGTLMGTKSLSEIVQTSTARTCKIIAAASAQNRDLWELAQQVATEAGEPIKKRFPQVLQKIS